MMVMLEVPRCITTTPRKRTDSDPKNDGVFFGGLWKFSGSFGFFVGVFWCSFSTLGLEVFGAKKPTQKIKPKQEFGRLGI